MIVSNNVTPERDLYYLGSKVIEELLTIEDDKVDYFELYHRITSTYDISINLYTLALDWLFIIGAIENAENGMVRKCF